MSFRRHEGVCKVHPHGRKGGDLFTISWTSVGKPYFPVLFNNSTFTGVLRRTLLTMYPTEPSPISVGTKTSSHTRDGIPLSNSFTRPARTDTGSPNFRTCSELSMFVTKSCLLFFFRYVMTHPSVSSTARSLFLYCTLPIHTVDTWSPHLYCAPIHGVRFLVLVSHPEASYTLH